MDGSIHYLNTDLDLVSSHDLRDLESRGVFPLHVTHGDDALWHATFETDRQYSEPEPNITDMALEDRRPAATPCRHNLRARWGANS